MKSIKTLVILIAALLLTACNSSRENPPNIVFILADDMGYSDLILMSLQKTALGLPIFITPDDAGQQEPVCYQVIILTRYYLIQ